MSEAMAASAATLAVEQLLAYALRASLLAPLDVSCARNALLAELRLAAPHPAAGGDDAAAAPGIRDILERMLDYAAAAGILPHDTVTHRDLFEAKLMGHLLPRPSEAARTFAQIADSSGIEAATDYWYRMAIDSCYVRMDRVARNRVWLAPTSFGTLEITINLSRPEKDPKEIALLLQAAQQDAYPKCLLCVDNVGYAGRLDHPARQHLRILPLELDGQTWYFQYSPYLYYNEHSIVLSGDHVPMAISPDTLRRLLVFLDRMPHYFFGSNSDLPIVGGSILSHDHYQAGRHRFPIQDAPVVARYDHSGYGGVSASIVRWPLSVVRLASRSQEQLLAAATDMLAAWRAYSDPAVGVYAFSGSDGVPRQSHVDGARIDGVRADNGSIPHNTITPIARMNEDGAYELDLVLRNNRTDAAHPDGIFHPHAQLHHIKRENIGLIEVMGLAVLPARLQSELDAIAQMLSGGESKERLAATARAADHLLRQHADWIAALLTAHGTAMSQADAEALLEREVGDKFLEVLRCCGVFKVEEDAGRNAFDRFMRHCGYIRK